MKSIDKEDDARGKRNVYHKIANNFQRLGVDIDWKTIQKKWHNMLSTYKRNARKTRDEVAWEYYEAMHSIMKHNSYHSNPYGSSSYYTSNSILGITGTRSYAEDEDKARTDKNDEEEEENRLLWTEDILHLLMEEMLVVKKRADKHLLNNGVVFREIADAINEELEDNRKEGKFNIYIY